MAYVNGIAFGRRTAVERLAKARVGQTADPSWVGQGLAQVESAEKPAQRRRHVGPDRRA